MLFSIDIPSKPLQVTVSIMVCLHKSQTTFGLPSSRESRKSMRYLLTKKTGEEQLLHPSSYKSALLLCKQEIGHLLSFAWGSLITRQSSCFPHYSICQRGDIWRPAKPCSGKMPLVLWPSSPQALQPSWFRATALSPAVRTAAGPNLSGNWHSTRRCRWSSWSSFWRKR